MTPSLALAMPSSALASLQGLMQDAVRIASPAIWTRRKPQFLATLFAGDYLQILAAHPATVRFKTSLFFGILNSPYSPSINRPRRIALSVRAEDAEFSPIASRLPTKRVGGLASLSGLAKIRPFSLSKGAAPRKVL